MPGEGLSAHYVFNIGGITLRVNKYGFQTHQVNAVLRVNKTVVCKATGLQAVSLCLFKRRLPSFEFPQRNSDFLLFPKLKKKN
jgi:hypothetical protein